MSSVRIALLGATSHIAKGLIACWAKLQDRELLLYARSTSRVRAFWEHIEPSQTKIFTLDSFGEEQYDVIINCIGIGSPQKLKENIGHIFNLTSTFDDLVLGYLVDHPHTLYVNMSSGAAYGTEFSQPIDEHSRASFYLNDLKQEEFYGIAKLHSEAKHRALPISNIVDLRIFGFFSRYIDLTEKFLLSEIISCLKKKRKLFTSSFNIWRDFLHPQDLASLIDACIKNRPGNEVYDAYSSKEVSKFELLEFFAERYGLEYAIDPSYQPLVVTGQKDYYYPTDRKAQYIGYSPHYTSLEGINAEVSAILQYT